MAPRASDESPAKANLAAYSKWKEWCVFPSLPFEVRAESRRTSETAIGLFPEDRGRGIAAGNFGFGQCVQILRRQSKGTLAM